MNKKTYFLGCPTPDGFSTHLRDDINSGEFITYIIKGGPGTGKSSLMKKIAEELSEIDEPELYYCSSDPDSLDAVVFRKIKAIIVDGTSPHVFEPDYPGVREVIVDLGTCWNVDSLKSDRENIISASDRNKKYHALVKRYLRAIISLNDDIMSIGDANINKNKLDAYCTRLASRLFPKKKNCTGKISFKQITSITPKGVLTHTDLFEGMTVFKIEDENFAVTDRLLKRLAQTAVSYGYDVTVSKNVFLSGSSYEHIIIPELNTAFVSCDIEYTAKINAMRFYDRLAVREKRKRVAFNRGVAKDLTNEAVLALQTAKDIHDELESYYIKAMDFDAVDKMKDKLKSLILKISF